MAAYEAIAQHWPNETFDIVGPVVSGVTLSSRDFAGWIASFGYSQPKFWGLQPVAATEPAKQADGPIPKVRLGTAKQFVEKYIAREKSAGVQPTKLGLEREAKRAGKTGGREVLRSEFDRQMAEAAPGRGRPTK